MKKIVLGIMILLLAGVLVAQSSFATSLINLGNEQTDGNNTPNPAAPSLTENNTDLNNTPSPAAPLTTGNNDAQGNSLGNNSGLNNSLTNNYIYNNSSNNASLPKTGLDNTVLFILTAVALISVVVTFKKISDYGNI